LENYSKKRLITFGCSYPYGHGLPDCYNAETHSYGKLPSKLSYPFLYSKELGIECINMSRPGSSIKEMCYNISRFSFQQDDIVLLAWTHTQRSCIIKKDIPHILGHWCPDKESKYYYKFFYTNLDEEVNTKIYIEWANLKLAKNKVINLPPIVHHREDYNFDIDVNFLGKNIDQFSIDIAVDNVHPGVKSHELYTKYLLEQLNV
jgi:hypothetical protein